MTLVHDTMIKAYRAGQVHDIRSYDFKFNAWIWESIGRIFPIEAVEKPIDVGITKDACFWGIHDENDITFVGHNLSDFKLHYTRLKQTAIHRKVDVEPSDYVFCIDQLNDLSSEDKVADTLKNLMAYSKQYIIISCWAYDIKIPEGVRCRKRHYWDLDNYIKDFEANGFKFIVKATNQDAINLLYVFKKKS
jgi:hypothetical protein